MTASVREKDLPPSSSLAAQTDIELMLAFQQGNARAFEVLYRRHSNCLMTYLYRRTGDQPLSEEIFQETWLRISKASQSYQPSAQFNTYLYCIARNVHLDFYRKYKPEAGQESLSDDHEEAMQVCAYEPTPARSAELQQASTQLLQCLGALPEDQRDVFLLREESGFSMPEIADLVSLPLETVKSRLRYALNKLRQCLADYY